MMAQNQNLAFDTHRYIKRMMGVGFSQTQAEAMSDEQVRFINNNLATKMDLEQLRASTKEDIEQLRASTKEDIEKLRASTKEDIEQLRLEIEKLRASTKEDTEKLRAELTLNIEKLRNEIKEENNKQTKWTIGAIGVYTGIIGILIYLT